MKIIIIIVIIIVGFYRQLLFQEPSKVHSVVVVSFDIFELMKIILFIEIGLKIFFVREVPSQPPTTLVEKCPQLAENGK